MDLRDVKADSAKELDGVWIEIDDTTKVRIAASGNERFQAELEKVAQRYRNGFRNRKISKELQMELITQIEAKTILVDWVGMNEDGVEVPYTVENAARILRDYPRFREQVHQTAGEFDWYKAVEEKVEEQTEGN